MGLDLKIQGFKDSKIQGLASLISLWSVQGFKDSRICFAEHPLVGSRISFAELPPVGSRIQFLISNFQFSDFRPLTSDI